MLGQPLCAVRGCYGQPRSTTAAADVGGSQLSWPVGPCRPGAPSLFPLQRRRATSMRVIQCYPAIPPQTTKHTLAYIVVRVETSAHNGRPLAPFTRWREDAQHTRMFEGDREYTRRDRSRPSAVAVSARARPRPPARPGNHERAAHPPRTSLSHAGQQSRRRGQSSAKPPGIGPQPSRLRRERMSWSIDR